MTLPHWIQRDSQLTGSTLPGILPRGIRYSSGGLTRDQIQTRPQTAPTSSQQPHRDAGEQTTAKELTTTASPQGAAHELTGGTGTTPPTKHFCSHARGLERGHNFYSEPKKTRFSGKIFFKSLMVNQFAKKSRTCEAVVQRVNREHEPRANRENADSSLHFCTVNWAFCRLESTLFCG